MSEREREIDKDRDREGERKRERINRVVCIRSWNAQNIRSWKYVIVL